MADIDLDGMKARAEAAAALAEKATAGPWHPRATDDEHFMNARFVGTRMGRTKREMKFADGVTRAIESADGFMHDNKRGLAEGDLDQEPSGEVIAITLLQQPRLADPDGCDENTRFIAAARSDVPTLAADVLALVAEVARLRAELAQATEDYEDAAAQMVEYAARLDAIGQP